MQNDICGENLPAVIFEAEKAGAMAEEMKLGTLIERLDSVTDKLRCYNGLDSGLQPANLPLNTMMTDTMMMDTLPDGYAGSLLVELEETQQEEEAACAFILGRARALAWQAVRHTPGFGACPGICRSWILRGVLWARRRALPELRRELEELIFWLDEILPRLSNKVN